MTDIRQSQGHHFDRGELPRLVRRNRNRAASRKAQCLEASAATKAYASRRPTTKRPQHPKRVGVPV